MNRRRFLLKVSALYCAAVALSITQKVKEVTWLASQNEKQPFVAVRAPKSQYSFDYKALS